MTKEPYSILTKLDQPPYGIRQIDGSWKLLGSLAQLERPDFFIENLILTRRKEILTIKEVGWNKLISVDVANYIKKHHPNLQFVDVSVSRDFVIFSQIQAHNINPIYWKGGHAGSVQLLKEDAKKRSIAEVIERTILSSIGHLIWSSALAIDYNQSQLLAKMEAIERHVVMKWWQGDSAYKHTENIIPYLSDSQKNIIDGVLFEWEPYQAKVNCIKISNPFGLEVVLAIVDAFVFGKQWRFYGNALDVKLENAIEKACLETLQFIPGPCSSIWLELENSEDINNLRVLSWSKNLKYEFFSNYLNFHLEELSMHQNLDLFYKSVNQAFESIDLECCTLEVPGCSGIYVSYIKSCLDWRSESGIPIV